MIDLTQCDRDSHDWRQDEAQDEVEEWWCARCGAAEEELSPVCPCGCDNVRERCVYRFVGEPKRGRLHE